MPFIGDNRPGSSFQRSNESAQKFHTAPQAGAHSHNFGSYQGLVVKDSNLMGIIGILILSVILSVIALPLTGQFLSNLETGAGGAANYLMLLVPLGAFVSIIFLIRAIGRQKKYGRSELRFTQPGNPKIGESFKAALFATAEIKAEKEYVFELECKRTKWTGSGKQRSSTTRSLYKNSIRVPASSVNAKSGIPIEFRLPPESQPTQRERNLQVSWALQVHAATPGIDFKADFPITVMPSETISSLDQDLESDET